MVAIVSLRVCLYLTKMLEIRRNILYFRYIVRFCRAFISHYPHNSLHDLGFRNKRQQKQRSYRPVSFPSCFRSQLSLSSHCFGIYLFECLSRLWYFSLSISLSVHHTGRHTNTAVPWLRHCPSLADRGTFYTYIFFLASNAAWKVFSYQPIVLCTGTMLLKQTACTIRD